MLKWAGLISNIKRRCPLYHTGSIEELFVHPDYHRRGIATALFQKAESECQDSIIAVNTTGFATPFYEAMGMRIVGSIRVTFGPLEGKNLIQLEKRI